MVEISLKTREGSPSVGSTGMSFDNEWATVEDAVRRFCRSRLRDADLAEDVLQETHIRAWRGYASFQRRASFLTWVLQISRNEIAREMGRKEHGFVPLESVAEPPAPEGEPEMRTPLGIGMDAILDAAATAGALSKQECDIVRARLADSGARLAEVGARFAISAGHCAVIFKRAMDALRPFIFRNFPEFFGGAANIAHAFGAALAAAPARRPTAKEEDAFACVILRGEDPRRGQIRDLQMACVKVARQLERG
jgi:RNA polymerase sigma factor (sigma-70 family)